jgi:DNA polymerase elongation subunit (family B)
VLWKDYAISYVKGKSFDVWRLADPSKPYRGKKLHTSAHIRIYDVFGFFQSSFSAVATSMVENGRATREEADFLIAMKDKRSKFSTIPIEEIKKYTTLELRLLARMMTDLREGLEQSGLHLRHWHGAGAAASALIESEGLRKHYGPDIAAADISPQQNAAHHAYLGGRIELLRPGYVENVQLHVHDVASAYPAAMAQFPSLTGGNWINKPGSETPIGSLAQLRSAIEATSAVSMFKIRFQFPIYERFHSDARKAVFIPFYPLPYRQKGGGILFPASGYGWYMRNDILATVAWLERFVPDFPKPRKRVNKVTSFAIEEAWIFEPRIAEGINELPFSFVEELFRRRMAIKAESERSGNYDIREKAIKLSLNSIYGKLAQSVGGGEGKPPSAANPYYAAATTAYCRRRLIEAALLDPHAIVFFATDAIVSTRPLTGLARVRKKGDVVDLGDWEYCEADSGLFVMPGVYTYGKIEYDKTGARTINPVTKLRGGDPKKYDATLKTNRWLIENVLAAWRKPFDRRQPETFPRIVAEYQKYITAGSALASRARWKLAGRWTARPGESGAGKREIFVHSVGNKRELIPDECCWPDYVSIPGREARRSHNLIRTIPALNNDTALSRPRMPEWIDKGIGEEVEDREEQEEIAAGFE